ncbi:MAG: LTA synthase family protein [Lachnospiraceae bacterium]|nr:LTA synthase family protein [Lachnospiraceae bacterium]
MSIWLIYGISLIAMELFYHFGCYGLKGISPLLPIALIAVIATLQTLVVCLFKKKQQKILFWCFLIADYILFLVQTVYYTVFRQPLQVRAALVGGQDALTNYYREAGMGILKALPILALLALPLVVSYVLIRKKKVNFKNTNSLQKIRICFGFGVSLLLFYVVFGVGKYTKAEYYEVYSEFYAPDMVAEKMGVITLAQRDLFFEIESLFGGGSAAGMEEDAELPAITTPMPGLVFTPTPTPAAENDTEVTEPDATPTPTPAPQVFELNVDKLVQASQSNKQTKWLAEYITTMQPTKTNAYTGMFEGYNLIYLTAEGFSTYAIHPELTPTLYKLVNSGFVFNNYYVPLWQTSTSDGEYVNCTGLIPDGQFSMRKSGSNNMAFSLPRFFEKEGVTSYAYHNNTMSYYDRYITHPNLGYIFKAAKLGECSEAEYGQYIFPMENPGRWPASDYEMMVGSIPEYINMDRFHIYYMTVSGHMYYSFSGNSMSSRNKDAVKHLDMSENARAYYACHIELDKALQYLIEQLEAAGKLENTVICLSADHYPYGMTEEEYEELAGKDLSQDMDKFRNSLILWNVGIEEPIIVDKACCSIDILPTLLNLFGFEFDSRMYAGRDIFSEEEGVVIFNNRSFVTDTVYYDKKAKTTTWKRELTPEQQDMYMEYMQAEVKRRYSFSAYILQENYYQIIADCLINP